MKIRIESKEQSFTIPMPTSLIFSDATAWIAQYMGNKFTADAMKHVPYQVMMNIPKQLGEELSPQAMKRLFAELRRIKKKYGSWDLVEVESADGQRISVTL